ncbi:hypothetical protein SH661x_000728 [Planctomicrobium sp. SH661]|uniref:hypothetical protein n=1 Tax=Planctomicrobium sp. SH661 TaxID=3448124 RepID=UPI003F5C5BAF
MNQIFLVLATASNAGLLLTFWLGWRISDPGSLAEAARQQVSSHFLVALGSVMLALLVHAIVLTYFMGTGRWIEETCAAYRFEGAARTENIRLKYRVIPGMVLCMLMLIVTGAFGAISDPASNMQMPSAHLIHFGLAICTILANIFVSVLESQMIRRNSAVVDLVYREVKAVRRERGLDPPEA